MKFVKRRFSRTVLYFTAAALLVTGLLAVSTSLTEPYAHIAPDYPKENILPVLSKTQPENVDYELLFRQTGLARSAVEELRKSSPDFAQLLLRFQENLFSDIQYVCEKNSPISSEESVVDQNGRYINGTQMAPLHNGYILITKSSHTYGWRNGHAALIVDAEKGLTLESVVLGTNSCIQGIDKWTNYPNFVLLRLKGASLQLLDEIAQYALYHLNGIPYDLTVGILNPKFKKEGKITGTHCSHLIWEAFRLYRYDLDSDGGIFVTPKDIANSPCLEVVQVFGVNPKEIWP
ncbi:MAG: hypothetical protein ABFD25_02750 [Clostridiaceae bacterium]